ncbi:hypothetical protein HY772_03180 [Candidatus Woesearchaeota archaeon]|nr:hypothetical protein [Candidatus Woesearchaeota archaeon]
MRFIKIVPIILLALLLIFAGCAKQATTTSGAETKPAAPAEKPVITRAPQEAVAEEVPATEAPKETTETTPALTEEEAVPVSETVQTIGIKGFKSYPNELTITVGTTVRWKNEGDNFLHIIGWHGYSVDAPRMPGLKPGQSWEYTFDEPGKLTWFSTAHPQTQGKITVKE